MDTVTMITKTIEAHELAHLKLELEAIKPKLNTSEHIQQQQITLNISMQHNQDDTSKPQQRENIHRSKN